MNSMVGEWALYAAVFAAAATTVLAVGAARLGGGFHRAVRTGFWTFAGLLSVCAIALLKALYESDFTLAYVASYTERALPLGYKLSAFWAGQEGSLLFWAVTLAIMSLGFVIARRREETPQQALTLMFLAMVCGFFAALVLFVPEANPFTLLPVAPEDGQGLNPMLQNFGMIAHPPTLFIGYAGFTIPFALVLGALLSGNLDNTWIAAARRWVLISWVFLTVGIVLGCQWAYVELGWGGYWAWDPVENASLLPWLTGTALLHSIVGQQQRGVFKISNALLAAVTFLLCIVGTYLTRSGIIQSVHAFPKSGIATFLLALLIVGTVISALAIIVRLPRLRKQPAMDGFVSKEGALLTGNAMLVAMTVLTLMGTIYPLISDWVAGRSVTLTQSFYNKAVLPLGLVMLIVMGIAPMLGYGQAKPGQLAKRLLVPAIFSAAMLVVGLVMGFRRPWATFTIVAVSMTVSATLWDFAAVVRSRIANGGGIFGSIAGVLNTNHRRYGGHLAHLGMAMMVVGIAGSSLYNTKGTLELKVGEAGTMGQYTLRLDALQDIRSSNYQGVQAVLTLAKAKGDTLVYLPASQKAQDAIEANRGDVAVRTDVQASFVYDGAAWQPLSSKPETFTLRPQVRKYDKSEKKNSEVAFSTTLLEDVYVTLAGESGQSAAFQIVINPLVMWIWIGGTAMVLGAIWSLLPVLGRSRLSAADAALAGQEPALEAIS